MLSVPPGNGWRWQTLANARPGRASSMYWSMSQAGGTAYPPDPSTRDRSRSSTLRSAMSSVWRASRDRASPFKSMPGVLARIRSRPNEWGPPGR